jgi:2-polyprenyl-3-methyl-5-hydroxy-6-metoxy-1,4-benzoquinol methylase
MNCFHEDVYRQLSQSGINFNEKIILDIGSRDGLNCVSMVKLGAKHVVGIDLCDDKFDVIDSYEQEKQHIELVKMNFFDMPETQKFDIITCFLWNINLPDYNKFIRKIKTLVKLNGLILIGIYDDLYKYGYNGLPNTGSVIELIENNFNNWTILDFDGCQWIIKIFV